MPTDTRHDNSFDEYVDTCMKISSVFATTNAVYMIIAGDFIVVMVLGLRISTVDFYVMNNYLY